MKPRQIATLVALCGTIVLASGNTARIGLDFDDIEITATITTRDVARATISSSTEPDSRLPTAKSFVDRVATSDPNGTNSAFVLTEDPVVETSMLESRPTAPPETRVQLASLFPSKMATDDPLPPVRPLETANDCLAADICIDEYLWSRYERTPKVDTNKVTARIKKTVKKDGKTRTITKTIINYVVADFTWKDPAAAEKAGKSLKDYVIGGMDRGFKLKLYRALRAMEDAGLMPGITSAFRDDYRQSIASGNKAASDSSFHGGSRRGGFGSGLAVDLVSLRGDTRLERYASSEELWKWIDAREKELGVGRPYRDRDPPHVGPIDGKEYVAKRGRANAQKTGLQKKDAKTAKVETKKLGLTARADAGATKSASSESLPKVSSAPYHVTAER